jgi:acetyl-CoA acetyltransferase
MSLRRERGGATGLAMVAAADRLVRSGDARAVLVAAGEDRASGQSGETSTRTLAQVGEADYEVPLGATIPAYYALLVSAEGAERPLQKEPGWRGDRQSARPPAPA